MAKPPLDLTQLPLADTLINSATNTVHDHSHLEPYLVVLSGSEQGRQFRLHRDQHVLGREAAADITIPDPKISRRHGMLSLHNHRVLLRDLNSTNGTYVNGQRIQSHSVALLDRIRVGDTFLKIDFKHHSEARSEQALFEAANIDAMTRILNRNAFMARAQQEFAFCKRNQTLLTVMMCDADHFKRTNDTFGHPAGDQVLQDLANILQAEMRQEDLLARYGGEEFIMLLRDTSTEAALVLAERIRYMVCQNPFHFQNTRIPMTISLGFCASRIDATASLDAMIMAADAALYRAKKNGRNRVEFNSA